MRGIYDLMIHILRIILDFIKKKKNIHTFKNKYTMVMEFTKSVESHTFIYQISFKKKTTTSYYTINLVTRSHRQ